MTTPPDHEGNRTSNGHLRWQRPKLPRDSIGLLIRPAAIVYFALRQIVGRGMPLGPIGGATLSGKRCYSTENGGTAHEE
jgi:hypothetical protein